MPTMEPFSVPSLTIAATVATFMSLRGVKRKSLTSHGAIAAWIVGFLSIACGWRGFLLLLFYVVGTKATKYKIQQKSLLDSSADESSCRGPNQVLACSVVGVMIQLLHVVFCGVEKSIDFSNDAFASSLTCALIAHHSTNLGDTLASELGILSKREPILITSGRRVPRGTNGGVTALGTAFSALGGFVIGAGAVSLDTINGLDIKPLSYILFGTTCGVVGSIIDSLLGATVQATHYDKKTGCVHSCSFEGDFPSKTVLISGKNIITNAQVNVVSVLITSGLGFIFGNALSCSYRESISFSSYSSVHNMSRLLTPALAFGIATSEATGNVLWSSPRHLSLLSNATRQNDGYNPGNIVLDFMSQCTGVSIEKESCLVSTTLATLMSTDMSSDDAFQNHNVQTDSCSPPDVPEDELIAVMTASRAQCTIIGLPVADEDFESALLAFQSVITNSTCFEAMCDQFTNPSRAFIEMMFNEAARCSRVELDFDQCTHDNLLEIIFYEGASSGNVINSNETSFRRSLQAVIGTDSLCKKQNEYELHMVVTWMLHTAQQPCSNTTLTSTDFDKAVSDLVTLFGSPECFGQTDCYDDNTLNSTVMHTNDDTFFDSASDGLNFVNIGIKFVEQCSGLSLDMRDCLVSTAIHMMTSGEDPSRQRLLQDQGDGPCSAPEFDEAIFRSLLDDVRKQCSSKYIEYSTDEYEDRASHLLRFFGAESCWISLCEESMHPSDNFLMMLFEEIAVCAGTEADVVNQCLWKQSFDIFISLDRADDSQPMSARRALQAVAGGNETSYDMCYQPSEADIGPFVGSLLMEAGQRCAELGEHFEEDNIDTTYAELIKFFLAPRECWGARDVEGCNDEGAPAKKSEEEINAFFVDFVQGSAMHMLLQCAGVQEQTCVFSRSIEVLSGMMQSCTPPSIDEFGIIQIADDARLYCIEQSVPTNENEYYQAVDNLMQVLSQPDCWEDICVQDTHKNVILSAWMYTCSSTDLKFLYSNAESTVADHDMILENDILKCMSDYIIWEKRRVEKNRECNIVQLGPNVCDADFRLGKEAYMHCSGDDFHIEEPTPSPVSFSMSYSFDNDFGWEDFNWADLPTYDMSFSYSFDDVIEHSMSYDFDDDHHDDDYPVSNHGLAYAYLSEVCNLLEMMQYNIAAKDCLRPVCDLGIESALLLNTGNSDGTDDSSAISDDDTAANNDDTAANNDDTAANNDDTNATTDDGGDFTEEIGSPPPTLYLSSRSPTARPTAKPTQITPKPTTKPITPPTTKPTSKLSIKPSLKPTTGPTASPTKSRFGSVDVKFDIAVTLTGINVSDLDFTALGAVIDLLEKVFASILPEGAKIRLLRIGGVPVTRRFLRLLEEVEGVDVEFEVIITEQCKDAACINSEDISAAVYEEVTSNLKAKVEDGSLSAVIRDEADAEGVSELANATVKNDSLKASVPIVTVKKAQTITENDDVPDDDTASSTYKSTTFNFAILAFVLLLHHF
ncbi:hypothetical protein ACHAW6_007888 [Cyclotella cf. meneghiniana]